MKNKLDLLCASYDCGTKDRYDIRYLSSRSYHKSIQAAAYFIQSTRGCVLAEKFKASLATVLGVNEFIEKKKSAKILIICDKEKVDKWKKKFNTHSTSKFNYVEYKTQKDIVDDKHKDKEVIREIHICPWSILTKHPALKEVIWDVLIVAAAEKCSGAELGKPSQRGIFVSGNEETGQKGILAKKKVFLLDIVKLLKRGPLPLFPIIKSCLPGIKMTRTEFINKYCEPIWMKTNWHSSESKVYLKENRPKDELVALELQWLFRTNGGIRRMQKDLRAQWINDVEPEKLKVVFNLNESRRKTIKQLVESPLAKVELYDPNKKEFEIQDEIE